jgi:hypothetical protein
MRQKAVPARFAPHAHVRARARDLAARRAASAARLVGCYPDQGSVRIRLAGEPRRRSLMRISSDVRCSEIPHLVSLGLLPEGATDDRLAIARALGLLLDAAFAPAA